MSVENQTPHVAGTVTHVLYKRFLMYTPSFVQSWIVQHPEMCRYIVVGVMNTAVNALVYNALIFSTGVAEGKLIALFSLIAFAITVIHSFVWNKRWVFKKQQHENIHKQFVAFWVVTATMALINTGIIYVIVNIMTAPAGVTRELWANVALAVTIPVAFLGNFFGIKFFVFGSRLLNRHL